MGKKVLSLLIVALMLLLTLTGCNTNELAYLNLSKELGNITQYKLDNTTKVEISENLTGENLNIELSLKGDINLDDLSSMYVNLDVNLKVNGIGNEKPVKMILSENKLYFSKNALLEFVKIEEILNGSTKNQKAIEYLYNVELKDIEYILAYDLSETYGSFNYKLNHADVYESAETYLKNAFKGFESKLLTKISGGYKIELTSEKVVDFIVRLIDYVNKNRDLVFDETIAYFESIFNNLNIFEQEGITEAEKEQAINELKNSREEFYEFIDEAAEFIKTEEFKTYTGMVKGTTLKEEITKAGKSYNQKLQAKIVVENVTMGTIEAKSKITPATIAKIIVQENYVDAENLDNLLNKSLNIVNPVKKLELRWHPDSEDATVIKIRLDEEIEVDYRQYVIIEDRVYLPLRYIGESLSEEVQWDNDSKKAYVVRETEKIDMTGLLINSTTMVKIRDFEKLGYVIGYEQVEGYSVATIEK